MYDQNFVVNSYYLLLIQKSDQKRVMENGQKVMDKSWNFGTKKVYEPCREIIKLIFSKSN